MEKSFKIFIDFDGTITKVDIGDEMFKLFGDSNEAERIIIDLLDDKISARTCWEDLCKNAGEINQKKLDDFILSVKPDEHFAEFISYCRNNNLDFYVLSDGFDYYIERFFAKENLHGIKTFSNRLTITENNRLKPEFPYYDPECRSSANCKRNHIINCSSDDDYTLYIGDGNSDKLPAQYCDFVFAKDSLLKFCEAERISFFPFKSFNDVKNKIEILRSKKNLKKRHQAELKRKEAYMAE
jgi:2-hydroxy-3-keto-5-methylthiopentenyl-1-phosphate phosphatase